MAALSAPALAAPKATPPFSPATKLRPPCFLRLRFLSPLPHRLICQAADKSSPPRKSPSSSDPSTLLDDSPADDYYRPPLPGDQPDFWEGPGWDILGFITRYLWAIGIVVALIGCGVAVKTYNLGATDFKETPVFKKAMKAQGFAKEPAGSKVFEKSPKEAPSVEENPS